MLDRIIKFSISNRLLILVAALLLIIGGIYAVKETEVDVFPDLNAPTVVVMTEANGMATEDVEQLVTFPIETALNGSTGVRRVRSTSTPGFSVVWVEFDWGTDIYIDRQIVAEKLAEVRESLPSTCGQPTIGPQSSILGEMLVVGLTSDTVPMDELRTIAEWVIRPRLLATGGVAQVSVIGGDLMEYQILPDTRKMAHFGVTLNDILDVTDGLTQNVSGGVVYEYGNEYLVRGVASGEVLTRIGESVVKSDENGTVRIADVAQVKTGPETPRLGLGSEKTHPAVLLTVTKQPDTGTIELTEKIESNLNEIKAGLPKGITVSTDIFRQSEFIAASVDNVRTSLLEGALFVVIVLFLFLGNIRTTVISLVTIPVSVLVALLTMRFLGMTINTMSLGGLAIAIGSLVDDAIVDVENVWKRLRENSLLEESERKSLPQVVFEASREVRMPILNSTLIIIASFLPLFFLSGMEGRMLVPLGIAFITALMASTVVALTLTPVLCTYLLKHNLKDSLSRESFITRWLKKYYRIALEWVLDHKRVVVTATLSLFIIAIGVFFTLGSSFLPPFNEGSLTINVSSLPGISLDESDKIGREAEKILMEIPEIKTVARKTGRAELDEHALGVNVSEIDAPFELKNRSREEMMRDVRERLSAISGANIEIGQPISHRIDAMLSGTEATIAIKLFGSDLGRLYSIANKIKGEISDIDGIADLNVEQQIERPEIKIIPRPELLAQHGISEASFNRFIAVMLGGETVGQVFNDGRSFNLTVRSPEDSRDGIDKIKDLLIDAPAGYKVPLSEVAEVVSSMGPNSISRENVGRRIVISANCNTGDVGGVVDKIRRRIESDVKLPEGYHVEYGGQFESQKSAGRVLLLTSLLSIIIIFLLLYMQFKDMRESAVVLLNLPFALIGGVLVLRVTSGLVSIPAIIGFISLFGIATRNGMLLITRYDLLRENMGLSLMESVIKGSLDRLNPIMMTALTSALALIPLAVRGGLPGNEIQSPMAVVILGGLITSTILNGFIIPIVYLWINKKNDTDAV